MKGNKNKYYPIFTTIIVLHSLISCDLNQENCQKELKYFEGIDSPVIAVRNKVQTNNDSCIYEITYNYWFSDRYVSSKGKLLLGDSSFFIKLYSLESQYVKYFDFSKKITEAYSIVLLKNNEKEYRINIILENILVTNNKEYYFFKFLNSFQYDNNWTDTVIIASLSDGIIGSYFTYEYNGKRNMLLPKGDILENKIDYSDVEIRYIK
jgi:hypothetical protein